MIVLIVISLSVIETLFVYLKGGSDTRSCRGVFGLRMWFGHISYVVSWCCAFLDRILHVVVGVCNIF